MRFPGLAISLAALAAILLLAYSDAQNRSFATSPPSAERFSIDMDPHNSPANIATSLGSRELCAAMTEDNILDFDEDFTDTVAFDVTVTGIPASNAMIGYAYTLSFPGPATAIVGRQPMIIDPIGIPPEPPFDTDGTFNVSKVDPYGAGVSGSGVLDRLQIRTQSLVPGSFPLTLSSAGHMDINGGAWAPDALDNAIIELNSGGCPNLVDIELVSLSLTSVNPVPIGVNSTVTVDMTIRNNGPQSANADANTTFNVPSGCTVNGLSGIVSLNAALGVMSPGATVNHQETPALRCTALGSYQVPITVCGQLDDAAALDLNNGNNCQTQSLTFDVVAPPRTDSDGDGVWDLDEFNCGVSTFGVSRRPERMNGFDDDGDGQTDEVLPAGSETWDCDGDGYKGEVEAHVFQATDRDQRECGTTNWAADFVSGGIFGSTDKILIDDLNSFLSPRKLDLDLTGPGDPNARWDLAPGKGIFGTDINIGDLTSLLVTAPAMFGGNLAFNGLTCGPTGCTNATWCTNTSNPAGVELRLETDRLVYHMGEPVQISLTVANTGADYVYLSIPWGSCIAVFMVESWSSDCSGLAVCMIPEGCTALLPPGSSFTIPTSWNQVDGSGVTVARGHYAIFANLGEDSCLLISFPCSVPPLLGSGPKHWVRLVQ